MTNVNDSSEIRVNVYPEPTPAAVGRVTQETVPADHRQVSDTQGRDRWAKAGRREVLRVEDWERQGGQVN
jgi:hypothetical protein